MTTVMNSLIKKVGLYLEGSSNRLQGKYRMGRTVLLKNQKAIYFPIPKVACTSILKITADLLDMKVDMGMSVHDMYFPGVQDIGKISTHYNDYFKFAFVRNPWDRLVSCYSNKIRKDPNLTNQWFENGVSRGLLKYGTFKAEMPFEQFVETIIHIPDEEAEKHFKSQCLFLTDTSGNLLVDFVGKFENLGEDLGYIGKQLNLDNVNIPHLQKSPRKDYRSYYSDNLKRKVEERFFRDITLFKYSF